MKLIDYEKSGMDCTYYLRIWKFNFEYTWCKTFERGSGLLKGFRFYFG